MNKTLFLNKLTGNAKTSGSSAATNSGVTLHFVLQYEF